MIIDGVEYTDDEVKQAAETYPYTWVIQHGIKNEVGMPIEFEKRKFLKDIYNDLSPLQVWLKPPQIGATVCQTIKSFFVAKKLNRQIIYTLPTQSDIQDMVGGSINRIIAQNTTLMEWVHDHDTVEQKQVGDSMIFYRGTYTSKQAMMIPSGLNIHDEVDASDADVIVQYENRLQAQEDGGWRWYFSHPSLVGHGVDIYWEQSDKKEWIITCPNCEHKFFMQWPRNIDRARRCYICHACKAELPEEVRINGQWMPTAQGEFSGWHVSQLMLYNKSADDILDAFDDPRKDEQYFWNYVLGLPYVGSENKISSETVLKNVVSEVNEQNDRIIIGVDTGLPWYLTCMNKQGVFYYEELKKVGDPNVPKNYDPKNRIRELLIKWPSSVVIGDQGGELSPLRILQQEFVGRVYLCFYRKDRKSLELIRWGEKIEELGTVTVDRNRMFQLMVEQLRDIGRIRLNGTLAEWKPWAEQFDNVYRELKVVKNAIGKDISTNYGAELIWKRNGPDHFCHTLLYCMVGMDRFGAEPAAFVKRGGAMNLPVASDNPTLAVVRRSNSNPLGEFREVEF